MDSAAFDRRTRQALTMKALSLYGVNFACLLEVRPPDTGHRLIKVPVQDTTYHQYRSGVTDGSGHHGVVIALSSEANSALLSREHVSSRLARVRLRDAIFNLIVIRVYASTLTAYVVVKEDFYNTLQATVDSISSRDLIVAGDWNRYILMHKTKRISTKLRALNYPSPEEFDHEGEDKFDLLQAICVLILKQLSNDAVEKAIADYGTQKVELFKPTDISIGFDIDDPIVKQAATALRLLQVNEMRRIQNLANVAIVKVQKHTADPRTDEKLGQVGF